MAPWSVWKQRFTFLQSVYSICDLGIVWNTKCSSCHVQQIAGILWRCVNCLGYYLCTLCYMADKHSPEHEFLRIDTKDMMNRYDVNFAA